MRQFFLGKIYQYYLNAYTDAYLSSRLIKYAKGEIDKKDLEKRLWGLLDDNPSKEQIVTFAYGYYFWNGFYDYMWARLYEKYLGRFLGKELLKIKSLLLEYRKKIKMEYAYIEFDNKKIILLTPLLKLLFRRMYLFEYFVKRNELNELTNTPRKVIATGLKSVQRVNIVSNGEVSEMLLKGMRGENTKADFVFKACNHFSDPTEFINSCAGTLMAASRWDKCHIWLLTILFGRG